MEVVRHENHDGYTYVASYHVQSHNKCKFSLEGFLKNFIPQKF